MGILTDKVDNNGRYIKDSVQVLKANPKKDKLSAYTETPEQRDATNAFLKDFRNAWQTMHLPRIEFNDMSLYQRHIIDMMGFNTYQENDGNPMQEDRLGGWKSTAMRPVIRNKAISIAAHRTARLPMPKVFAYDQNSEEQQDSAQVMSYLVDYAKEQANYRYNSLFREIAAIYSPISWGYSEYQESYRKVKDEKVDGKWTYKIILDDTQPCFQHIPVPTDQVFFTEFYERDCQKQDAILLRRIISYDKAKAKYGDSPNFQFVTAGIIVTMDDANSAFYNVYDPHMRGDYVEEVIRWRKSDDSRTVKVNGIWMTDCDAVNPRNDHQYPWDNYYYLPINERCIAGKSLVFAMQSDANIVNKFYRLIEDGSVMNLFPPTVTSGSDKVGMDVMVPGLNLAFADKDVKINSLNTATDQALATAMKTMDKVETSISESSADPVQQGQSPVGPPSTAYEISRIEQNAETVLGFSMQFRLQNSIDYGKLVISDILQYLTLTDASKITTDGGLVYKTFIANDPSTVGKKNKVQFDANLPDTMSDDEKDDMEWELLMTQSKGSIKAALNPTTKLWKANPIKFRNYKYSVMIDADVQNPRSADLNHAYAEELYNDMVMHPEIFDAKETGKLLLSNNPLTQRAPDDFLAKTPPPTAQPMQMPGQPMQNTPNQPVQSIQKPNQQPVIQR